MISVLKNDVSLTNFMPGQDRNGNLQRVPTQAKALLPEHKLSNNVESYMSDREGIRAPAGRAQSFCLSRKRIRVYTNGSNCCVSASF
jgi:hypothetical protein